MDQLAGFQGVALPCKDIDCRDNELVHPRFVQEYASAYSRLTGRAITSPGQLIEAFFEHHGEADLAGFKTMFNRHPDLSRFVTREDIQFITLTRRDIPATVASFMLALEQQTWRRSGGDTAARWTFCKAHAQQVAANLEYVFQSNMVLSQVPGAIKLVYEDLCQANFMNPDLDACFGRHVAIDQPKSPTDASRYVSNWDEFVEFLQPHWQALKARFAQQRPGVSGDRG